jgi:S-methylmethionine-dependent homocysteine/selenocysteine methylase
MARAMARTGVPYLISFVVNRQGKILDGASLEQGIQCIDAVCDPAPVGYMVNCSYPSFLRPGRQPRRVLSRLVGFQANGSALDHAQLDGAATLQAEDIDAWADLMVGLHKKYGIKILGGCCGTGRAHLQSIVRKINA